ncbi:MAG: 50S ribosomal protein L25 [Bacteroidota bacterium]
MKEIELKVLTRETGKKSARGVRNIGNVPGIYYTKGAEPIAIHAKPLDLRPVVYTSQTRIINLLVGDAQQPKKCVLKDVDFDPVSDELIHFDLLGIKEGQQLTVEIPVMMRGQASGVRTSGGRMNQIIHKIKVKCMPSDLIEVLEYDVTNMEIGDSVYLRDLKQENVEFDLTEDAVVCTIVPPRIIKDTAASEAEEGLLPVEGEEEAPVDESEK